MQQDEMAHGEIIIVRRNKSGEEEHHGGVWKIAFADFMTAMMAFFLVMWLINASNEETKKAVASYFNPIKLTDTTTNSKGIKNPKYGVDNQDKKTNDEVVTIDTPAKVEIKLATDEKRFEEQALFVDPYAVLAEIEGGVGTEDGDNKQFNSTEPGDGSSLNKGVAFQDPFDPNSWDTNQQVASEQSNKVVPEEDLFEAEQNNGLTGTGSGTMPGEQDVFKQVDEADLQIADEPAKTPEKNKLAEAQEAEPELKEEELISGESQEPKELEVAALGADEGANEQELANGELTTEKEETAGVAEQETASGEATAGMDDGEIAEKITEAKTEIKDKLEAALTQSNLTGLDVEVTASKDGVIVVLSDNNKNGMFTIGSARPTPAMVKTMAKLGGIVAEQNGKVEISGHTDGRPYQSKDYDNWRLSSARAHMAYYMLVRGGMEEARVEKIVGQAAVNLKDPENPNSAVNRRIEILIKPL